MRVSRRGAGLLALAAMLLPGAARADELLVMPYTCTVVGGQPVLTPGAERGHRILGARDQRKFNACSPVNPGLCRQWTVHRFDLDCDGTRVPWVSVVAATNEGSRRAWLLNGRLVLRMGPRWSLPADDPCAQEAGPEQRFEYRRMRRYCADRLALAPAPVVEMPFGYAPMLGLDGIFVKGGGPAVAGGQPALPPIAAAPPGVNAQGFRPEPPNPMPELFPSDPPPAWPEPFAGEDAPARPAPAVPPQATPPQPQGQSPSKVAATPPAAAPAAGQAAVPPPLAEPPKVAHTESKPAAPQVNLGPRVVTSAPAPKPATEAPAATPAPSTMGIGEAPKNSAAPAKPPAAEMPKDRASSPSKVAAPLPRNTVEAPAALSPTAETNSGGAGVSLLGAFRTTTVGALVAFGGLALGLLTAFALARRNESIRDARRRPRDLSSVSLGNKRSSPPTRITSERGNLPPNAAASAMSRVPGRTAAASTAAEFGDRMPETRAEAMQVLGIGVAPTANEAAIKKIVDGLRQSWHPDLARDETDRVLRELRSKQINAAWELLRGQRAVV
jgi:hypothetical protein